MRLEILNTSVVVAAKGHNPTILHPAFLCAQKVVPEEWNLKEAPICTPAVSIVKYDNGIAFTVDADKFQLMHNGPGDDLSKSQAPGVAYKYIATLPHVCYTGVGVNFVGFVECEKPADMLIERFLTVGNWNNEDCKPEALGLQLLYDVEGAKLRLSCNAGALKREQDAQESVGIRLDCNYHTPLSAEDYLNDAQKAIFRFPERYDYFREITRRILELEE
jgi:hypothetical protein